MEGGSFPCSPPRQCKVHDDPEHSQGGALRACTSIRSLSNGQLWRLQRRITCMTRNLVYYILCPCSNAREYVGSAVDMRRRWSKHKSDVRKEHWENCGLTRHYQQFHQADMEHALGRLQVTLLDHLTGAYSEESHLRLEKDWIVKLGTFGPQGLNTRDQLLSNRRRDWGNSH